jgi:hypothetical protein
MNILDSHGLIRFDGLSIAEIISVAQQHQFDDLTLTIADV